jgi:RHS repeat-associated protein
VTAAWSGIVGPTATDWIGLYVPGSADTDYLRRQNTNGAASGSAAFALPATLVAGTYELRLFANNTYTLLATSNTFSVTTLSANPPGATQGGSTTVTWTNIISPTVRDWIALATPASPNGTYLSRRYTTGTASGSTTFDIPAAAALQTYELRLFANNTTTRLATTTITIKGPFSFSASPSTVAPGASATATWANILAPSATDWVGLYAQGAADAHYQARAYTSGVASGSLNLPVPADTGSGSYELRLFSNDTFTRLAVSNAFTITGAAPSISASPSSAVPGDTLTATWGGIYSPTPNDWVALYQPGLSDTEYLRLQLTGAVAASGSAPFQIPAGLGPGTYELRLLSEDGATLLATSSPITVTTVTTDPVAYIHPDHLDTPRLIENQAQQVVWRWDNEDPFGANLPDEDPSGLGIFTCNLRLPGQYFDVETNYHYNYFRDYSPGVGRYIQSDPIGLAGGTNTYSYVLNDPIGHVDFLGLQTSNSCKTGQDYLPDPKAPGFNFCAAVEDPIEKCRCEHQQRMARCRPAPAAEGARCYSASYRKQNECIFKDSM